MERTKWPALGGLVLGTIYLSHNVPSTFAFDKPLLSAVILLTTIGVCLIGLGRYLPRDGGRRVSGAQYNPLPLDEVGQPHSSRAPSPSPDDVTRASSPRKLRIVFIVFVCALCLRVQILLRILGNVQCSSLTWEPLIPLVLAIYDYWTGLRHQPRPVDDDPGASAYHTLEQYTTKSQHRYLIAVGLVSIGGMVAIATTRSPDSTYICAASLSFHWLTPLLQRIGTILDVVMVYCIVQLIRQQEGQGTRSVALRCSSIGWAFMYAAQFSALIIIVSGTVYYTALATKNQKKRMFEIPTWYVWSIFKLNIAFTLTVLCAFLLISHISLTTVLLIPTFVSICTTTTSYAWSNTYAFPPIHHSIGFFAICLALLGFALHFHFETMPEGKGHSSARALFTRVPSWFYTILLIILFARAGLWAAGSTNVNYHPIDLLIYDAQKVHETYFNQTSSSKTLTEAANTYRQRYKRHPPPGFNHWYEYATARNSVVIDDFDTIYRDLLPFHALDPEGIRHRSWQMISNPWHDASGLSIRDGKVEISPNVKPTHRWMLDGLVAMINHFVEFLPDMDLAFNINDECRVAVPYEQIEGMRTIGRNGGNLESKPDNSFSAGRAEQWKAIPEEPNQDKLMEEFSSQRTFYEFGNAGCPPSSPARNQRLWDVQRFCPSCARPHSIGSFLANWTLAADICHQPDAALLHGLYITPAAFKASHDLYPIFSQSKAYGFNDILYPSAWNYLDKAKYDPNDEHPDVAYANKNNTVFWRGATSEGLATGLGQWKGMTRQRFVRLANPNTGISAPQSILIPYQVSEDHQTHEIHKRLVYQSTPLTELENLVSTDVHFVNDIARCGGIDCPQQAREFAPLVPPTDFQAHWQYKFLLDLDGAGFSGRFLPFLSSRSLPMKAALFREWWDDRVTAWKHFVPLDLRGHGFWATLAYFAGLDGTLNGKHVKLEPHEKEAERIAEDGRDWAGRVLRKEDMEIYFFRLLLEWGRLTDDRRDEIGFDGDVG